MSAAGQGRSTRRFSRLACSLQSGQWLSTRSNGAVSPRADVRAFLCYRAYMLPDATKSAIIQRIKATTVEAAVTVTDEADLYEDLGIYGDDFDDIVVWISETFGTDFSTMKAKFAPGEAGEFGIRRFMQGKSPYQRCTVGDLLKAVECGRWRD
jgi:hypothetical protein